MNSPLKIDLEPDKNKAQHKSAQDTSVPKDRVEKLITAQAQSNKITQNDENKDMSSLKTLTNIEEIRDFMDYTENCLKMILSLKKPKEAEIEKMKLDLPDYMTVKKKLAIFDLDETLVHCELKNPKVADKIISIKLPNGSKAKVRSIFKNLI